MKTLVKYYIDKRLTKEYGKPFFIGVYGESRDKDNSLDKDPNLERITEKEFNKIAMMMELQR
jgi:hypothetical protein